MKIVFDWQDDRYFTDRFYLNGRRACSILKINDKLMYSVYIYQDDYIDPVKFMHNFSSLEAAKEWCDKELIKIGIKILSNEYKVLL